MTARASYAFPPILMGREMAAAYIDVSPRELDNLQAKGLVIPKDRGGRRAFHREDLDAYAASLGDWETTSRTA